MERAGASTRCPFPSCGLRSSFRPICRNPTRSPRTPLEPHNAERLRCVSAHRCRLERSAALVAALEPWMRAERAKLSRYAAVAKAMDCMLARWRPGFGAGSHGCLRDRTRGLHTAHLVMSLYLKEIFLTIVRRRASRSPSVGFEANGLVRQLGVGDYPGRALAWLVRGQRSFGDQTTHG